MSTRELISVESAAKRIRGGEAVAIPTETVYGLAAEASNPEAIATVYAIKGRPAFNPLIVHVSGAAMAGKLVRIEAAAQELMARFWPGPLTLVLPRLPGAPVAEIAAAGLATLAVRAPAHPQALELIDNTGFSLAAPSANRSGGISPTQASHVNLPVPVVDGGPCKVGLESTIVAVVDGEVTLLRPGSIPVDALGLPVRVARTGAVTSPGQLPSHYAPRQPVRLGAVAAGTDEFLIGFGEVRGDASLSPMGDLTQAAARLFDLLHRAEASGCAGIAVAPVPDEGLGRAINDRLRRAAAPRS